MSDSQTAVSTTEFATSSDGTRIAFERAGSGPVLVLVDGAMCYREFGGSRPTTEVLRDRYTVVIYDRRGRGESGNTLPYTPDREVEDLRAVIKAVGDDAIVLGQSSGAGLAYRAAADGVRMRALIGYEAPYVGAARENPRAFATELDRLIAEGKPGKAVDYFMIDMVKGPWFMPVMMRAMRPAWKKLLQIADTLPYDARVMSGFLVPDDFDRISVPTLVLQGGKAKPDMVDGQKRLAEVIPEARYEVLDGQTHQVDPKVLAAALDRFVAGLPE